jgi:hypothetical protein
MTPDELVTGFPQRSPQRRGRKCPPQRKEFVMNPRKRSYVEPNWKQFATSKMRLDCTDLIVDEAIHRLESGDVSLTRFGIRVAVRHDLGDESERSAYWPKWEGIDIVCFCERFKDSGECSHVSAANIFDWWLEEGEDASGGER